MSSIKAASLCLIALSILGAGDCKLYAGSTYTWYGPSGATGLYLNFNSAGDQVFQPVPAGPAQVQIYYDPTQYPQYALLALTSGDTTTFQFTDQSFSSVFNLSINNGLVGFSQAIPLSMVITAPAPGGGLDTITFFAESLGYTQQYGSVEIMAPNGTLSSSAQLPASLTAFEYFGLGSYDYGVNTSPFIPEYFAWDLDGTLGVPEPPTIVSATIGMALTFCFAMLRGRPRRRLAAAGSPSRG